MKILAEAKARKHKGFITPYTFYLLTGPITLARVPEPVQGPLGRVKKLHIKKSFKVLQSSKKYQDREWQIIDKS